MPFTIRSVSTTQLVRAVNAVLQVSLGTLPWALLMPARPVSALCPSDPITSPQDVCLTSISVDTSASVPQATLAPSVRGESGDDIVCCVDSSYFS